MILYCRTTLPLLFPLTTIKMFGLYFSSVLNFHTMLTYIHQKHIYALPQSRLGGSSHYVMVLLVYSAELIHSIQAGVHDFSYNPTVTDFTSFPERAQ